MISTYFCTLLFEVDYEWNGWFVNMKLRNNLSRGRPHGQEPAADRSSLFYKSRKFLYVPKTGTNNSQPLNLDRLWQVVKVHKSAARIRYTE